jgi:uncharacterized protein YjiS (DUF1127 family)
MDAMSARRTNRDSQPSRLYGRRLIALIGTWRRRLRDRRELASMSDDRAFLRDLGLTRSDALHEIRKPFWRA